MHPKVSPQGYCVRAPAPVLVAWHASQLRRCVSMGPSNRGIPTGCKGKRWLEPVALGGILRAVVLVVEAEGYTLHTHGITHGM